LDAVWLVLEFEWERREGRKECAIPGVVKLEARPVANGLWNWVLAGSCWSLSERGGSGGRGVPRGK
jgi:hypothetical protein